MVLGCHCHRSSRPTQRPNRVVDLVFVARCFLFCKLQTANSQSPPFFSEFLTFNYINHEGVKPYYRTRTSELQVLIRTKKKHATEKKHQTVSRIMYIDLFQIGELIFSTNTKKTRSRIDEPQ
jgi:hypothetical protein